MQLCFFLLMLVCVFSGLVWITPIDDPTKQTHIEEKLCVFPVAPTCLKTKKKTARICALVSNTSLQHKTI